MLIGGAEGERMSFQTLSASGIGASENVTRKKKNMALEK